MAHDWHLFDVEAGYECRKLDDGDYEVRRTSAPDEISRLTAEEFEELRREGPSPKGLT